MDTSMTGMEMINFWELVVVLGTLVLMAAAVVGVIFLAIWLSRRSSSPPAPTPAASTVKLATCPRCGLPLPADAPQGLCPRCVLLVGIGTRDAAEPAFRDEAGRPNAPDPAELAGHFPQLEIIELLGQGGMGAVYKARQKDLDRLVALKVLPGGAGRDPAFAERFMREARALAKLSHPNIVAVHDFGQIQRTGESGAAAGTSALLYYFIMEFIDGPNLRQLMRGRRLSPREAMTIVPQICEALQFAHDGGVVHRDIKPENILLDRKGRVKIADFGIAKIVGKRGDFSLTGAKDVIGTPHYMAPEQVEHPTEVDHRADIYSLGVVFYEMLTGELPLGKFEVPSRKVRVDVRLDEVVLHALEKEPERRYQRASEVKTDVETIATGAGESEVGSVREEVAEGRQGARHGGWQPVVAGLVLAASVVGWALLGYLAFVQPSWGERFAAQDLALSFRQRWMFSMGSLTRHFGLFLVPILMVATVGSFVWLVASAIRPVTLPGIGRPSAQVRIWAVRKAWGFGTASLCFVFGALIWGGRALKSFALGAHLFVGQQLLGRAEWDAFIALLNLVAAVGFGVASYRQWEVARGASFVPQTLARRTADSKAVIATRWTARVLGTVLLVFYGFFILVEGLPPIASQPGGVQLNFVALGLMLGGFAVGWKREGTAALLIASGWTLWHISEGEVRWNLFQTPLPVAALYAYCWWASRGRRTGVLAGSVVVLAAALALGRLFVPTNVFVEGMVIDSVSGRPVANAKLTLAPRTARPGDAATRPNTRSDSDGRFRLYVGWYRERQPLVVTATGYAALVTNLGPRDLGQRWVQRNFPLRAAETNTPAVADTNPVPRIEMQNVPLRDAIENCASQIQLNVLFDPQLEFDRSGPNGRSVLRTGVNVKWEHVTVQAALKMLLDNYGLQMQIDPESGIARISKKSSEAVTAKMLEPPPVVIRTVPESGASDVDPGLTELRVSFSKPMKDGNWSWCNLGDGSFPDMAGEPHYLDDGRTCVLPVKLQPARVYATWINLDQFQHFQDRDGRPAVPYLLIFQTRN